MRLYLGIDAGQTSTKCVLGDERGNVISAGAGKGKAVMHWKDVRTCNKVKEGLKEVILKTVRTAGLQENIVVEFAFLGYTGLES